MGRNERDTHVSPTERTIPNDTERTIAAPRFDEKSVQGARPAVPLTLRAKERAWPVAVFVICIVAGLVGGVLGGLGLALYRSDGSHNAPPPAAQQQTAGVATATRSDSPNATRNDSTDATAPSAPPAQDENRGAPNATEGVGAQRTSNQSEASDSARVHAPADGAREAARAATAGAAEASAKSVDGGDSGDGTVEADAGTRGELRAALGDWIAATNARDIDGQMKFYAPTVNAFYLARNASRESVRAEKTRVFASVSSVDVRASAPDIRLSRDGQTAVMRFHKRYRIGERGGEVLQELRWRRTPAGWKIVGERDLRVLQ